MRRQLVFATNNRHKIEEISHLLGNEIEITGLREIGCHDDIPETADTLEGNAILKAKFVHDRFGSDCFADDTGLEIKALGGKPGVFSARYAGPQHDFDANIDKVLDELRNVGDRSARFRTVIALILDDKLHLFEGIVDGSIIELRKGKGGFGYDSVFMPEGYKKTFAEMSLAEKNTISHRARAVNELVRFLRNYRND